jgi:putative hydrolase of the HAD superfamily
MSIAAVVFDLGNVLLPFDWDIAANRFCARVKCSRRELDDYIVTTPFVHQLEIGELDGAGFYRRLAADFGFTGDYAEFATIWSDIFTADEAMLALAARLKGRLPRFILSNTNPIHMEFICGRFPAIRDFDGHVLSHEVGALKPDRRIYEATLRRLGVTAGQVVFVDDIRANVEGARAVGMQAIQHRDAATTRAELTKLGLTGI